MNLSSTRLDLLGVIQEIQRYNLLLSTMTESLESALCGLDGNNLVTEEIAQLLSSIEENEIPECWDGVAYPTLDNLDEFVRDLVRVKENHLFMAISPKHRFGTRSKEWSFCGRGKRRALRRSIG